MIGEGSSGWIVNSRQTNSRPSVEFARKGGRSFILVLVTATKNNIVDSKDCDQKPQRYSGFWSVDLFYMAILVDRKAVLFSFGFVEYV